MNGKWNNVPAFAWLVAGIAAMGFVMAMAAWSFGYGGWMQGWGGMMAFGWIWMLVPLALMAVVMYGMMSMGHGGHGAGHAHDSRHGNGGPDVRSILDERYAAGDMSREEYLRVADDLDHRAHR